MRDTLNTLLPALGFLFLAIAAGWWVGAHAASLLNFRSPLHKTSLPPAPPVGPAQTRRLVLVVIDGLRYDTSLKVDVMPTLAALRAQGAYAEMTSLPPTPSQTGYTTLLTGVHPEISDTHLINAPYDRIRPITVETIFTTAHRAGLRTAIAAYYFFEKLIPPAERDASFFTPGEDAAADDDVMAAALPQLKANEHALVLIHLDQVDYAGDHEGGPFGPRWNEAASRADALVARVLDTLDLARDTLIVISDHGQIDRGGHGGHEMIARREPFIAAGAGIRPGDYGRMEMVDVAPTIAALLGIGIPSASQGKVLPILAAPPSCEHRRAQQTALGRAYLSAIGAKDADAFFADSGDPVGNTQTAMAQARAERLARERLPRRVVAPLGLGLLAWLGVSTLGQTLWPALLAAGVYLLVFHGTYALVHRRAYSLSGLGSAQHFLRLVALDTLIGFIAGAIVMLSLNGIAGLNAYVAVTAFLAALPAAFAFMECGLTATWAIPDLFVFFLGLLGQMQLMVLGVLGAVLPLVLGGLITDGNGSLMWTRMI